MATISSMLKLTDAFSSPIEKSINAMNKMVDVMENVNRSTNMPNADKTFAEIRTEINLASHALDELNNGLNETDKKSKSVSQASFNFNTLGQAIIVANQGLQLMRTTWQAVQSIGSKADERIGVDARLGLVNDGLQTQAQLEAKVLAVANNTRSSYESTADLVAKMGRQDYFKGNNNKALNFAATLNKGLVVSGASASEASGAITQLSQGLASGVLRGDEFNSIMENAPILAEMMTKSMGITKGQLRSMAEDGKLTTDVVVSGIMAQSATLDKQFAQMPMTFGQAQTVMGNDVSQLMDYLSQPGQAVDIIIKKIEELTAYLNTPQGTALMENIAMGLTTAANILSWFFGLVASTYNFFASNWSWIGPIVIGIAAAIGILIAVTLVYNGIQAISTLIKGFAIAASALHAGQSLAEAAALEVTTGAQVGLNTALLACPITWIIAAIILLIVIIYAIVGAINQVTGSSISATGVIMGSFAAAGAFIWDLILGVLELVFAVINALINPFIRIANFIGNVFTSPVSSIIYLFQSMADGILSTIQSIASALDFVFGSKMADTVGQWRSGLKTMADAAVKEYAPNENYKNVINELNLNNKDLGINRVKYSDAYNAGYGVGKNIDNTVGGAMDKISGFSDQLSKLNKSTPNTTPGKSDYGNAYKNPTGGKLDKVNKIGDAVDISDQSLQYLNDIATAQALDQLNSYQTVTYEQMNDLQLSQQDADALRNSANKNTNIYYLNYSGGAISIKNDVKQGEDWEDIKARIHDETESQIETGLSGIDEVVA